MITDPETGEIRQDEFGREIPDDTPLELPVGFKHQETIAQMVARLVRKDVSEYAAKHDMETFAEADDFDLEDEDFDPQTPYETNFDPLLNKEITAADFTDPDRREWLRSLYLEHEKNRIRAEDAQDRMDEAFRAAKHAKRGAGVSPAPGSEAPKAPIAKPPSEGANSQ